MYVCMQPLYELLQNTIKMFTHTRRKAGSVAVHSTFPQSAVVVIYYYYSIIVCYI